jgi:hypothetical protein
VSCFTLAIFFGEKLSPEYPLSVTPSRDRKFESIPLQRRESMSAVTAGSPHNSIARGRSSICHGRATRRSVLNFSDSVMIAAENSPTPALHIDTVASGTSSSNPACSSRQSVSAVNAEAVREKPRTLAAFCEWLGT